MDLATYIRDIPDWPKEGIVFKDITPLLASPEGFREAIDQLAGAVRECRRHQGHGRRGTRLHLRRGACLPARRGLRARSQARQAAVEHDSVTYDLEYGTDSLEVHSDAVGADDVVLIVDDVLATGGTAAAKAELVHSVGATVAGFAFLIELDFLGGRTKLAADSKVVSLIHVD